MNPHDADNAMAGDYVMGLLDDAEHAAAERRIATDQSFAQAVSAWRFLRLGAVVMFPALILAITSLIVLTPPPWR